MKSSARILTIFFSFFIGVTSFSLYAQEADGLEGRWNLTISQVGKELPSWLEISHSGNNTLIGRFTYAFGSARPISEVKKYGDVFYFSIPPQWEPGGANMEFEGKMVGDEQKGTMVYTDGKTYDWTGSKSPDLPYVENPKWGKTIELFNGKNLDGWKVEGENQWKVVDGILTSSEAGANLISEEKFTNFKLHAEFRYPEGSNSGLYLRGRYEIQIADNAGL